MAHTLQFEQSGVNPNISIIHDTADASSGPRFWANDSFRVQWTVTVTLDEGAPNP
jgi:hypothetical protein